MESKHSLRNSKLFRALLVFLFLAVPVQWAMAQLTLSTPRTTLGTVIKQIQSQSKYQFFYNDKLSTITVEPLKVKDASLEQVLSTLLKDKAVSYKIEENIIYLSEKGDSNPVQQQSGKERTITGQVLDSKGEPLIGVSILVKGTTDGAITDLDGNYKIITKSNNPIIIYSYIGYKTQEVPLKGQTSINITLMDDTQVIDEVVVTALGIKRSEKALSYNVTQVDAESALAVKDANFINSLNGKVAGLNINSSSSGIGGASKVVMRGSRGIEQSSNALYVIDGIPMYNLSASGGSEEFQSQGSTEAIADINPEDIDRIDVLKDASATAIYGVKAANGVIVITTKKGKYGKPIVHYSGNVGISLRPSYNNLNRMNSKERIDVSKEIEERGLTFGIKPSNIGYEGALYDLYAKRITQEQFVDRVYDLEKVNTDWYDELFRTDVSHKHSLSISGGSEFVNYYFSAGYANTNAVVKGSDVENYNALLKLNLELSKRLNVGLSLRAYAATKKYLHGSIDPYGYAYNTSRAIPAYNEDGSYLFYNKTANRQ